MARGYNIRLPLNVDGIDGPYILTKEFDENARQNIKMIILTEKGEKISDPAFGCGLRAYLFEPHTEGLDYEIGEEIKVQLALYAPYVSFGSVQITKNEETQSLHVHLWYTIPVTNSTIEDVFEVTT